MNKKRKDLKSLIKLGRPTFGDIPKGSKHFSLDQKVLDWLPEYGASAKVNTILLAAMTKEDYDSQR